MQCAQELCHYWAGDAGCPCAVLDMESATDENHEKGGQ